MREPSAINPNRAKRQSASKLSAGSPPATGATGIAKEVAAHHGQSRAKMAGETSLRGSIDVGLKGRIILRSSSFAEHHFTHFVVSACQILVGTASRKHCRPTLDTPLPADYESFMGCDISSYRLREFSTGRSANEIRPALSEEKPGALGTSLRPDYS
jgi:hypothetical protein